MTIDIKNRALQIAVLIAGFLILAAVTYRAVKANLAKKIIYAPSTKDFEKATSLEPGNAKFHDELGRLYEYSPLDMNRHLAVSELRTAIALAPTNPQSWLDLGAALEFGGKKAGAAECLLRADQLAPNIPRIQWAIGNLFLLHGNVTEAFHHLKVVLNGNAAYDQIVFPLAWKASSDGAEILRDLIPANVETQISYLNFLAARKEYSEAARVWKVIRDNPQKFPLPDAEYYLNTLLYTAKDPAEAYSVWKDLSERGLIASAMRSHPSNLMLNGDFEDPLINMGFDWIIHQVPGASISLDTTNFVSPGHSLSVLFDGTANVDLSNAIFEWVKVKPGNSYELTGDMMAKGITGVSGARLEVRDAMDPAALDKFSQGVLGDTEGWSRQVIDFTTGPKTDFILVNITRPPSPIPDSRTRGEFWVDNVALRDLTVQGPGQAAPKKTQTKS